MVKRGGRGHAVLTPMLIMELHERYKAGQTLTSLASEVNVSKAALSQRFSQVNNLVLQLFTHNQELEEKIRSSGIIGDLCQCGRNNSQRAGLGFEHRDPVGPGRYALVDGELQPVRELRWR